MDNSSSTVSATTTAANNTISSTPEPMVLSNGSDNTTAFTNSTDGPVDEFSKIVSPHWLEYGPQPDLAHYGVGLFMTVVGITGVLGNLLVIYIFSRTKHLRTPSNMFVVNLALSDMSFCALNGFPLTSISAFSRRWVFGKLACELYGLMGGIFGLLSINTLAVISIDRYNVIARSLTVARSMNHKKAFMMLVVAWLWAVTWSIPPLFGWGKYGPEGFLITCSFDYMDHSYKNKIFFLLMYIFGFMFPLFIIIFCYIFIIKAVANHEKEMANMAKKLKADNIRSNQKNDQSAEIRIAKISMMIVLAFLLSWTPYAVVALIGQFGNPHLITPLVSMLPVLFAKTSAMYNPIIYALSHPKFREAVDQRFPWLLACCMFDKKETVDKTKTSRERMSRQASATSQGGAGGSVSDMSSIVSNLSDSAYTSNDTAHARSASRTGKHQKSPEVMETSLSTEIRSFLQAFVGAMSAQQSGAVPQIPMQQLPQMYLPPQYAPHAQQNGGQPQGGIYSVPVGALPQVAVADGQGGVSLPGGVAHPLTVLPPGSTPNSMPHSPQHAAVTQPPPSPVQGPRTPVPASPNHAPPSPTVAPPTPTQAPPTPKHAKPSPAHDNPAFEDDTV